MWRTRVGYCGGTKENPTYRAIGDHAEAIQMDFDPQVIPYAALLRAFWRLHAPEMAAYKRQYMSAVFCHSEEQQQVVTQQKEQIEAQLHKPVQTEVLGDMTFYLAEDYHQKYRLRRHPKLLALYTQRFSSLRAFVDSTAVTRLNGYVAGYGNAVDFERELPLLGLPEEGEEILAKIVHR